MPSIAIVAGDASGDLYGAALAGALNSLMSGALIWGAGGPRMRAAGVDLEADFSLVSSIGLVQSSKVIPKLLVSYLRLRSLVAGRRPDVLILIDFGGFNRRLSGFAKRICIKTAYFIPPGSWRKQDVGAAKTARCADLFLSPFPWSAENLRAVGANAEYVGHPLLDIVAPTVARDRFLKELGFDDGVATVALLPGSRRAEIAHVLPALLDAADIVSRALEGVVQFVVGAAPSVSEIVRRGVQRWQSATESAARIAVVGNRTYDALSSSNLAIITSGTATLEAAILGTPMVIVYRGSGAMAVERLFRPGVLERHIGLPNIIAGSEICPEIVGGEATGERIAAKSLELLENGTLREEAKWNLNKVKSQLGQPGAVIRSAELITSLLGRPAAR